MNQDIVEAPLEEIEAPVLPSGSSRSSSNNEEKTNEKEEKEEIVVKEEERAPERPGLRPRSKTKKPDFLTYIIKNTLP